MPFGRNTLYALGCAHRPFGETDLWKAWLKQVRQDKTAFALLCGDTLDFARTHYREHLRSYRSDKNSQIAIDRWVTEEVAEVARDLEPIKGKIIGAILGNHAHETVEGINSEQLLCQRLGVPYLGVMGAVRLDFMEGDTRRQSLTLVAHHSGGSSGASSAAADLRQLEAFEAKWDADIYVLSHTHRRQGIRCRSLAFNSGAIRAWSSARRCSCVPAPC
jgi:predicted phosphodiesterase